MKQETSYSQKYQYLFHEHSFSHEDLEVLANYHIDLTTLLPSLSVGEQLQALDDQLQSLMWQHIDLYLTQHQRSVIHLTYLGLTQWEIAEKLGVNQSSIYKTLQGNSFYNIGHVKRYGGIANKLTKTLLRDPEVQAIMRKIEAIYTPSPLRLPHYQCFKRLPGSSVKYQQWLQQELTPCV